MEKIKVSIYFLFAYLGIELETISILMVFMVIDTILGGVKAMRLKRKFRLRKMLMGFTVKSSFLLIPIMIALLGRSLNYDLTAIVGVSISILTVAEAYSILGNIYAIKNRVKIEKIDGVSMMLRAIRDFLKEVLINLVSKLK